MELSELLLSENEIQGQEKNQNMGPYTGYFRGEMPCNLHQIRGNKRARLSSSPDEC